MTLAAAILLFGLFFTSADTTWLAQSTSPQNLPASASSTQQAPSNEATPATKPASKQPPPKAPGRKPKASTAKKSQRTKNAVPEQSCDPPGTNANSQGSNTSAGSTQAGSVPAPAGSDAQKNCPPAKIVVRQGGITEQSIQLAGASSGGDATGKRDSTNQMLAATEDNLKKAASVQLSPVQQNSVSQIRQFVDQSKKALKAADFERAHTLAWKAKVLSDDLANPK